MVVVVVVVASIYIRGAHARTRARIHNYQHGCQVVSHKRAKKNPRTLAYASYGPQGDWKPDDFRNTVVANSWRVC